MLGVIFNTLTVTVGSLIGLLLKNGIKEKYKSVVMTISGVMITALGLNLLNITKIKVADFMPALVFIPIISYIVSIFI